MTERPMKAKAVDRNRNLAERLSRTDFRPRRMLFELPVLRRFLSLGNDTIMINAKMMLRADDARKNIQTTTSEQ